MSFKMKRTLEMRRVESAFADYLENEDSIDLLWSDKVGYVFLTILMQMMTRLQRFADVGSLTSTCFLSIGVHAEHFTQQNKRKAAFSMICPLYSFQCFISLFAI